MEKKIFISMHDLTNGEGMGIGSREGTIKTLSDHLRSYIEELESGESFTVEFERVDMTEEEFRKVPVQ